MSGKHNKSFKIRSAQWGSTENSPIVLANILFLPFRSFHTLSLYSLLATYVYSPHPIAIHSCLLFIVVLENPSYVLKHQEESVSNFPLLLEISSEHEGPTVLNTSLESAIDVHGESDHLHEWGLNQEMHAPYIIILYIVWIKNIVRWNPNTRALGFVSLCMTLYCFTLKSWHLMN